MIEFAFTVDDVPPPSGFDLGHMAVRGAEGEVSSRGHSPDQAMMIYLSLSHLLDGVGSLIRTGRPGRFEFGAVDSSFALTFTLTKGGRLMTRSDKTAIGESDAGTVAHTLWAAAKEFADRHVAELPADDAARSDLEASLTEFREVSRPSRSDVAAVGDGNLITAPERERDT